MEIYYHDSKIPDTILVLYKFQNTVLSELCRKYDDTCVVDMKRALWNYFAKSLNVLLYYVCG